jgi:hypothetical protein
MQVVFSARRLTHYAVAARQNLLDHAMFVAFPHDFYLVAYGNGVGQRNVVEPEFSDDPAKYHFAGIEQDVVPTARGFYYGSYFHHAALNSEGGDLVPGGRF